jgi:Tol biopolymer transport system component
LLAETQLIWFDRAGKPGEPVIPEAGQYRIPALSPDGKKLAVTIADGRGDGDIWMIDFARKTKIRLTFVPSSAFSALGMNANAVWEPDGKSIVFASNREGLAHIYRVAADGTGSEDKVLETPDVAEVPYSISADARYLAYTFWDRKTIKRQTEIWALPLFGTRKPFPVVIGTTNTGTPAISPDGKWVAYWGYDTGREEVYLKPFPAGEGRWQVSTHGGSNPQWRRDGKELFFFNSVERAIMAVDVRETATGVELGTPHQLFRANAYLAGPYCASADGQRFLINGMTGEVPSVRLTLVTNWPADLKK